MNKADLTEILAQRAQRHDAIGELEELGRARSITVSSEPVTF